MINDRDELNSLFDLSGRAAIITGATRGIGKAIAHGFGAAGASIVVASRKADACDATVAELEAAGVAALGVPTHVGELEQLEALVSATVDRFGGVDIVVNNAANALAQPIGSITADAWEKSHDANLRAPLFLVQNALPHLAESEHASVINFVSVGGFMFAPFVTMYAAAKAGLLSLTRSMAAEFAGRAIRVNAIAPGAIDTDMVRNNPPEMQDVMAKSSLLGRLGQPDEIVPAALYLASDASSFVTGQCLFVDGGTAPPR